MTNSEHTKSRTEKTLHQRNLLRARARKMRHQPTRTEWLLWQALRCKQLGVAFRRQVVLRGYIADFYSSEASLIVEVDGAWHARRHRDARRDRELRDAGYRVLRVSTTEILSAFATAVAKIRSAL